MCCTSTTGHMFKYKKLMHREICITTSSMECKRMHCTKLYGVYQLFQCNKLK